MKKAPHLPRDLRYLLLTIGFVLISEAFIIFIPQFTSATEQGIIDSSLQIPANNSTVAGVQTYVVPPTSNGIPAPTLTARSALVKDLATGTLLYQKDIDQRLPIASTTKIMTALVSSEYFSPNSVLTVNLGAEIEGSSVGLTKGEKLTYRSLLYGMLLNSGNDAAFAIAENYPGGVGGFVQAMNNKVVELQLQNTNFQNPAGFDSPIHYSSSSDLARITEEALKDSELRKVFATKDTDIVSLDKKYTHPLHNLNKLLSTLNGALGVKTGYTDIAKENLVTYIDRNNHQILSVLLGSDDRFGETTTLVEWTYSNYSWR